MAYKGNVCHQKGSPRVHWNIGRSYQVLSLSQADIVAYIYDICNQKEGCPMVNWMIGKYAKLKFLTQSLDKLLKPFRREADGHCGL